MRIEASGGSGDRTRAGIPDHGVANRCLPTRPSLHDVVARCRRTMSTHDADGRCRRTMSTGPEEPGHRAVARRSPSVSECAVARRSPSVSDRAMARSHLIPRSRERARDGQDSVDARTDRGIDRLRSARAQGAQRWPTVLEPTCSAGYQYDELRLPSTYAYDDEPSYVETYRDWRARALCWAGAFIVLSVEGPYDEARACQREKHEFWGTGRGRPDHRRPAAERVRGRLGDRPRCEARGRRGACDRVAPSSRARPQVDP